MIWPEGMRLKPIVIWPGAMTPSTARRRSPFFAKWHTTVEMLRKELRALGATEVILQIAMQDKDFRLDGYPRANAQAEHPGVILTMTTPHGPLSYPCDTFTTWQDNIRAITLSLSALRAVTRYGVVKHGEQYVGSRAITAGRERMGDQLARDLLFLESELSHEDFISTPYGVSARRAKRNAHPDTGGSTERWTRLTEALDVLGLA